MEITRKRVTTKKYGFMAVLKNIQGRHYAYVVDENGEEVPFLPDSSHFDGNQNFMDFGKTFDSDIDAAVYFGGIEFGLKKEGFTAIILA
jgi:hypothetical protein